MANKYNNAIPVTGFRPTEASPLDDRDVMLDSAILDPANVLKYYEDMVVRISNTNKKYIWAESNHGLFNTGHTYPSYATDINGINYANKTFNFVVFDEVIKLESKLQNTSDIGLFIPFRDLSLEMIKDPSDITVTLKSDTTQFKEIEHPDRIEVVGSGIYVILDPKPSFNEIFKLTIT